MIAARRLQRNFADGVIAEAVEDTRLMLQKLLENRFGLRVHRENRNRPAYVPYCGKGRAKVSRR